MRRSFFIHSSKISKVLLVVNCVMACIYFTWWFDASHIGNRWAYGFLFFGEAYHVLMSYLFWFTVWPFRRRTLINSAPISYHHQPSVDIFITVANEPLEIIRRTALAAKNQTYQNKLVYLL